MWYQVGSNYQVATKFGEKGPLNKFQLKISSPETFYTELCPFRKYCRTASLPASIISASNHVPAVQVQHTQASFLVGFTIIFYML